MSATPSDGSMTPRTANSSTSTSYTFTSPIQARVQPAPRALVQQVPLFNQWTINGNSPVSDHQDSYTGSKALYDNIDPALKEQNRLPPIRYADSQYSLEHKVKRHRTTPPDGYPNAAFPTFARQMLDAADAAKYQPTTRTNSLSVQTSPDLRRLSVNSLLSGPPGDGVDHSQSYTRPSMYRRDADGSMVYGYDYGLPDLDVPKNNDASSISVRSPSAVQIPTPSTPGVLQSPRITHVAFERGGYYAQPVQIKIPATFDPLPAHLSDNPMNLLYFHHFLNHTARILVPHDCCQNPLRTILPESKSSRS